MPPMPTTMQDSGHSALPPASLVDDAHTQLLLLIKSLSSRLKTGPKDKAEVNQPALILYCPIEGGETIIDITVQQLAQRINASVETIDIAQCIGEQPRGFWRETPPPGNDKVGPYSRSESSVPYGYFKLHEPVNAANLVKLVKKAISPPDAMIGDQNQHAPNRRIIYLRDFGFLATLAPMCYNKVISATQKPSRDVDGNAGVHIPTVVILGASPLLIQGGLFQANISRNSTGRDSYPGVPIIPPSPYSSDSSRRARSRVQLRSERESPDLWGEDKAAETHREQRLRQQHERWSAGTLIDHIHEQLAKIGALTGGNNNGRSSESKRIPTCVVVPSKRDLKQERLAREKRRLELNRFEVYMALLAAGGELANTVQTLDSEGRETFPSRFVGQLVDYDEIKRVADRAIATALASSSDSGRLAPAISWDAYCTAWKAQEDRDQERADWLKTSIPTIIQGPTGKRADRSGLPAQRPPIIIQRNTRSESSEDTFSTGSSDNDSPKDNNSSDKHGTVDPLVEKVKKRGLSPHQQKLLDCLICPAQIQTGFDSLHLPEATIDEMNMLVSLRLVCPEAFRTGILKQHNMLDALLFGSPGTGKTHLMKAIAKDSGARMISIKPSDILENGVGEEGKTIDALFKLAQALNPCIVFIDEIDALFRARGKAEDGYSRCYSNLLAQFTQAMDNVASSDVIVIGATNRPFDLDDAIIHRSPCRILVDLPDKSARVEILRILLRDEQLEPDVDLMDLATLMSDFSGSDLKHICLMAAFESSKEWAKASWVHTKEKKPAPIIPIAGTFTADPAEGLEKPSLLNADCTQSNGSRTRRIGKRHFTYALKRIRPSTPSTQTSLMELRRWNDQFGSDNHSANIESNTEEIVMESVKRQESSS